SLPKRPAPGAPFVHAREWWRDNPAVCTAAQDYFEEEELLGGVPSFGDALDAIPAPSFPLIRSFLELLDHSFARKLIEQLDDRQRSVIDGNFLSSFGRFWSGGEKLDLLIEPEAWSDDLSTAQATAMGQPFRSLLVCGEPGIGKTSFLKLLAKRLEPEGWTVFE